MKDKKLIFEKDFVSSKGRAKTLIWANLEAKETMETDYSPVKAQQAKQEVQGLLRQEKSLQQELEATLALPSNQELTVQVESEESCVAELRLKLEQCKERIRSAKEQFGSTAKPNYRAFQTKPKSAAQLARERCPRRLKMRINAMRNEWKNRMVKCKDFVDTLSDAMEKKPKEIRSLLDIETDEMAGVQMPPKHSI